MYDYLYDNYYNQEWAGQEFRVQIAERFLERYVHIRPEDIYRWLWEGEYGPGMNSPDLTIDRLNTDLRYARTISGSRKQEIWEPMGLAARILKINLVPYADSGGPFLRLLEMSNRAREIRPNTLRFKRDWYFMKTQVTRGMEVSLESMNDFENRIAFHMTPEVAFSETYIGHYGTGYRLVPRTLFFKHFPEYEPDDYEYRIAMMIDEAD